MRAIRFFLAVLCLSLAFAFPAWADKFAAEDYETFATLPVIHEGRVKPLGRAAQLILQDISGVRAPAGTVALPWLAGLLFTSGTVDNVPVFAITDTNLLHVLQLTPAAFYSFSTLNCAFTEHAALILALRNLPQNQLSDDQQALLRLYARVTYYEQIRNALNQPDGELSETARQQGENNLFFRIIPMGSIPFIAWFSPWQVHLVPDSPGKPLLDRWKNLSHAYNANDTATFRAISHKIHDETLARTGEKTLGARLKTELVYNAVQPHFYSLVLYVAGFILILYAFFTPAPLWPRLAWLAVSAGLKMQVLGLVCRMFILMRPPVSNLYESILFVGTLIVAANLVMAWRTREKNYVLAGAFIGAALQILGFAINDEAETLKVLQAVLDTRFWLATHVIIITSGYALCLLTSAAAHVYLYRVCWPHKGQPPERAFRRAYLLSLVSLLFIGVGTLLGGVWADQSWGRFWGWDPKENGALLIALWLVWLLHGRVTKHFSDFGFVLGLAGLTLVVGLSWIGVNLLGIGLHSYGFLNGSVTSLAVLFLAEFSFFAVCQRRKNLYDARL